MLSTKHVLELSEGYTKQLTTLNSEAPLTLVLTQGL